MSIQSKNNEPVSLQVTHLYNVSGTVKPSIKGFLVKNISGDDITLNVKMKDSEEYIETVFAPGWNPEQIDEIENVAAGTIQIGY